MAQRWTSGCKRSVKSPSKLRLSRRRIDWNKHSSGCGTRSRFSCTSRLRCEHWSPGPPREPLALSSTTTRNLCHVRPLLRHVNSFIAKSDLVVPDLALTLSPKRIFDQRIKHGQEADAAERPLSRDAQGYLFCREQDPQDASEDGEGCAVERVAEGLHASIFGKPKAR